jgi:hypothetical protein
MPFRSLLGCSRVCWCVLALALVSFCVPRKAQSKEELTVSAAQVVSDVPPAPADFDGDRVADPLTLDRTGWQLSVEIALSHTHEVSVIPIDLSLSVTGSLTVRDLDQDGDTDLVWKGAFPLAPPAVSIWLNDGTGRFAQLLSFHPPPPKLTRGRSLRTDTAQEGFDYKSLPSPRTASWASLPTSAWTRKLSISSPHAQETVLPFISFLTRHPSDRGPPTLL